MHPHHILINFKHCTVQTTNKPMMAKQTFTLLSYLCVLLLVAYMLSGGDALRIINQQSHKFHNRVVHTQPRLFASSPAVDTGRGMLASVIVGLSLLHCPAASFAATAGTTGATETKEFTNARYQTRFQYPANWIPSSATLSGERVLDAFVDPNDGDSSVSVVFNPIPADFNRLTSFGGKDTLRGYLLPKGDGVQTQVINENVKGEVYSLEYTISAPDAPTRHVLSIFALRPQDAVIGLNVQSKESSYETAKEAFTTVVSTFKYELQ